MSDPTAPASPTVMVTTMGKVSPSKIVVSHALEAEDEFQAYYTNDAFSAGMSLIEPPYNPAQLQMLCSENNTLGPCIDAMETNVDGTGYVIESEKDADKGKDAKDPAVDRLRGFFDEVYPGLSMLQLRKKTRRDLEQTGNAYIEVLRNLEGRIVFLRHVAARTLRIMRLDSPVLIEKELSRDGQMVKVPTLVRERRYAQMIGAQWIFFREFGSSRHINYRDGWWESEEREIPPNNRGTELIHLRVNEHYFTPYGLPRWEGQIPSVLGSRRSEEYNLDYFETGGIPPAMITISGGSLTDAARRSLEDQFNSKSRAKHRIALLEVHASGGTLDNASKVDVHVERFGSERQSDGLFQEYDKNCHDRTRRAFRLPPLFVGELAAMNFAVAYTSYLIAENQVFRPEREAFDDMVNRCIMPGIGGNGYLYRSKNFSMSDINTKLAALQIAGATQHVDPKDVVKAVNEIADLDLAISDTPILPPAPPAPPGQSPAPPGGDAKTPAVKPEGSGDVKPKLPVTPGVVKPAQAAKKTDGFSILALAKEASLALRKRDYAALAGIVRQSDMMTPEQVKQFKDALSLQQYLDPSVDPDGMSELASCSLVALIRNGTME